MTAGLAPNAFAWRGRVVAVTGATGFFGYNLLPALVERGARVRALRRPTSDLSLFEGWPVEWVTGDVLDRASLQAAFDGADVVFHLAGVVHFAPADPGYQWRVHVDGTANATAAARRAGVRRFVHASSCAAIALPEDGVPADETSPYNWDRYGIPYMRSKHAGEEVVRRAAAEGLDAVIVNPASTIGPGDVDFHNVGILRDLRLGRLPGYPPGGMTLGYSADVVRGMLAAAERGRTGERYILAGENLPFKDLFTIAAEELGARPPRLTVPVPLLVALGYWNEWRSRLTGERPAHTSRTARLTARRIYYSSAKAERELGYAITPFRQAVRETAAWYRERGYF